MALKYKDSKYLDYSGALLLTSTIPLDIRAVVENTTELIKEETWHKDGDVTKAKIAYKGMIVSVEATNDVYMCIDNTKLTSLENGWKKINGADIDLTAVNKRIDEVSTYIINVSSYVSNVSIDVSNLKFTVSNISTFVLNVSTRVDSLETKIVNVSNAIDDVSDRLSKFGKAFIYRGKGYYNSSVTPASDNYIVDVSGSTTAIVDLRAGDVYQTFDNKEWVYVDTSTHEGEKWVELGLPFKFKHYINGSTNSEFVNVSTVSEDDAHTTIIVDVSKSTLDSSNFEATGFVTDAQLKTALSWVVLD